MLEGSFRALSAITYEEWTGGLAPRFEQAGAPTEPEALRMTIELGENHPRSTMLIARESLTSALADRAEWVAVEHARAGWQPRSVPTSCATNRRSGASVSPSTRRPSP